MLLFIALLATAQANELALNVGNIVTPDLAAGGIVLTLPDNGSANLQIRELRFRQHEFRDLSVHCIKFTLSSAGVGCHGGSLAQLPGMDLDFDYRFDTGNWQVAAQLHNVSGKQFAAFLPISIQGELSGKLHVAGNASGLIAVVADVQLAEAGFSDASGLHAAEKLQGVIKVSASRQGAVWDWQGDIDWQSGELYWQPLYLKSGHKLSASGSLEGSIVKVEQAIIDLPDTGRMQFSARWDHQQLLACSATGDNLALDKLFADYLKPFLGQGALAGSSVYGHAGLDWQYRDGATQSLRLTLRDAGIADAEQRFALLGVNSDIDWQADQPRSAEIAFAGGALLGMPLGAGRWQVGMRGMEFGLARGVLPVLDGWLELQDLQLYRENAAWHWQFGATLSRISMEQFSQAAGWPKMHGFLSGRIPRVSYADDEINVEGELLFDVFDGKVTATGLKLSDPFGRAPRLYGNLSMRGLDLDLLTRTFSFGNIQGRIDADVNQLELQDWQPARFDVRIYSSAGDYPKKISQKAVQNISSLGGAGAVAALQRSYLRFFENFGYDRIAWSCVLKNGICAMGGVEGSDVYTIIKGGGIPAITVMGYNRNVSWVELLTRLKRITQNQAVIK